MMLTAISIRDQLLAPILNPSNRMAASHGEPRQTDFLTREDSFVTETATDIRRNDADLYFRKLQNLSQPGPHNVRELRGAMNDQLAGPAVPMSYETTTFDRRHNLPGRSQLTSHFDGRRLCNGINIATIKTDLY